MRFPGGGSRTARIGFPSLVADPLAAVWAAMTPYPGALDRARASALVAGLKADGLWTLLDGLTLHDGFSSSQASRVDLKDPTRVASVNGTLTFTAYSGFKGDGSTGYLDYGVAENAAGLQWGTFGHIGAWVSTLDALASTLLGLSTGTASLAAATGSAATSRIHNANAATGSTVGPTGHLLSSRTGSTTLRLDVNGVTEDTHTTGAAVAAGAGNFLGLRSVAAYGAGLLSIAHRGGPLTYAQSLALYNRLVTYRAAAHN